VANIVTNCSTSRSKRQRQRTKATNRPTLVTTIALSHTEQLVLDTNTGSVTSTEQVTSKVLPGNIGTTSVIGRLP